MKRERKVKITRLFLISLFVVISMYSLFITKVDKNDYFYQIKNNKIELAKGFCWKRSLKPIKLEQYFATSFDINSLDEDKLIKVKILGRYTLFPNKTTLAKILNNAKIFPAFEINESDIDKYQYVIDQEVIKRIQKVFGAIPENILLASNYKLAISGALNEIVPQQGIENVTFLSLEIISFSEKNK